MNTDNRILVERSGDEYALNNYAQGKKPEFLALIPDTKRARAFANLFALAPELLRAAQCALAALSQPATHKADIALARESLARALNQIELELPIKSMEVLEELERIEKSN